MMTIVPRRNRPSVLVAVLSAVALTVIVVVVPAGLYKLGGLPGFHIDVGRSANEISRHSDGQHLISDWLMRGALLLAWVSWAWMTICVGLEIRSRLTGRRSTRLPASRTVQSLAAFLVGTAMAISTMGRMAAVSKGNVTRSASVSGAGSTAAHSRETPRVLPLRVIDDRMEASMLGGRDNSPGIGVRSILGHPQPDIGASWGEPRLTYAEDAPVSAASFGAYRQANEDRSAGPSHLVAPRETLWSIAGERLGSSLRWKEIATLNYEVRQADGGTLTAEHWIRPGWTLELPRGPERANGEQVVYEEAAYKSFDWSARSAGPNGVSVRPHALPLREPSMPLMPVGGGVVGAGVVGLLDRMRRVQQRHRNEGAYIRLPDQSHSQFEQRLRLGEGREVIDAVDAALRLLEQASCDPELCPPRVMGITVHSESIELFVESMEGCEALSLQFCSDLDRRSVSVERSILPATGSGETDGRRLHPPAPLLVTAGHGPDGLVMVNLESLGTLQVNGNPAEYEGVVRALALELATSHWSGWFDLNVVGFGVELERFERVVAVVDVPMLLDSLHRRRLENEAKLADTTFGSFAHARYVDYSNKWDPVVVLLGPTVAEADVCELLDLASDPRLGIAVVAPGTAGGGLNMVSVAGAHRASSLELLGSVLVPQQIEPDELNEVTALVDTASNRQSVLLSEEPYVSLPVNMPVIEPTAARIPDGEVRIEPSEVHQAQTRHLAQQAKTHEVEVAVLGQIEINGAAREFTRAWSKELVIYLAMHPKGASNEAWATALWPDRLMAPSSLHSTASVARRALGQAHNGTDHLPRSHGRLRLADTVGTDWDRFVVHADSNDPARWRAALELVRGRPFDGLRSTDWPILEGIGPAIEAAVVDLSGRLAGACLAAGDSRGAEWAARRGLLVSPYDERLYRMLMRAADVGGNPAGVEAVMAELIRLVANEIEPFDSVHPSTMDLYRSLTRRQNGISRLA